MASAVLAGSTGLVGSHILSTLSASPSITSISAFARKDLPISEKLTALSSPDTDSWPSLYPKSSSIFLSALGTSRARAGGLDNQRKIDYDLNLALAKQAKEAGTRVYVLISSAGANANAYLPYPKMKGELETAVSELGFEHTVILRPGLLVGDRQDSRPPEFALRKLAGFMGRVAGNGAKDFWAQDAEVVARAAVNAGVKAAKGEWEGKGTVILGQADIVRLGRTEWKAGL